MKTINIILFGLMLLFYGCSQPKSQQGETKAALIEQPTAQYLSDSDMQEYIKEELNLAVDMGNQAILNDAANALNNARNAMLAIRDKNYREARELLTKAMAKTKLLLAANHTKALAEITVEVNQGVKNVNEAYNLINEIDSLINNKEYQKARDLIQLLSNELFITRENLLIRKFDEVLKRADQFFRAKNYDKAVQELNGLVATTTVEHSVIPLPVIRADRMLAEAAILFNQEDIDYNNAEILLNNAAYEIKFAELLGYTKQKTDFNMLVEKIESLKKSVSEKNEAALKNDIKNLTETMSQTKDDFSEATNE